MRLLAARGLPCPHCDWLAFDRQHPRRSFVISASMELREHVRPEHPGIQAQQVTDCTVRAPRSPSLPELLGAEEIGVIEWETRQHKSRL